jgi:FHA domain
VQQRERNPFVIACNSSVIASIMATCPLCLFSNSADATECNRCGKFRFPSAELALAGVFDSYTSVVSAEDGSMATSMRTVRGPASGPCSATIIGATRSGLGTLPANTAIPSVSDDTGMHTVVANVAASPLPAIRAPKLVVIRGERMDAVPFPIYEGKNYVGRASDKPVDIDLTGLEAKDQIWSSRQHAVITFDVGAMAIEDLNSLNGTFVNRSRLHPGQLRQLNAGDVIQIGTVQFRVDG